MTAKDKNGQSRKSDHDEGETGDGPVVEPLSGVCGMIIAKVNMIGSSVMPGLDPGIRSGRMIWIAGSSPAMTSDGSGGLQ